MYDYNNPMMGRPHPQPMTRGGFDSGVIVFVPAVEDIERVPVMSGEKVYVMAMNDAVIACRTGGNMGTETTFCKMEEFVPAPAPKPEDYITKADLEDILSRLLTQQSAGQAPAKGGKKSE